MRLALAIASLVILGVHGLVFYQQFFHRWERHQTAYFDQARSLTRSAAERAALAARSPRIEQAIVTQFGEARVDRCQTCHIASDDPRFEKHAQPLRTHPYSAQLGDYQKNGKWERRHKFADFGCTICHDGQGRGLKEYYSHGEDHYWPSPMLGYVTQETWKKEYAPRLKGREYMEAACAQCHTEEGFASTPHVERGRRLFFSTNCYGCHRIDGISDGTLGPDLTQAGHKFKLDYLWESIAEPRANSSLSFMPKFKLSDADVKDLVIFLKSRRGVNLTETQIARYRMRLAGYRPDAPEAKVEAAPAANLAGRGEQLIRDRACTACHKLGDADGGIAPDLTYAGLIKDEKWIMEHFKDPRARIPDSIMPAFRFPQEEFEAMTAYLAGRKTPPQEKEPAGAYRELCARCHGDKGDGNGMIALYLDPSPRDFTKAAFMNSKADTRLLESIAKGVPGTSMPAWERILGAKQQEALLGFIFASFVKEPRRAPKERKIPDINPVASGAASIARGESAFVRRCAGCHGRKGDGKGPNSIDILPRPRNLRNREFVASLSDRRLFDSILYGVQGTAMPPWIDYGLTPQDVGDLVNFIRSLNQPSTPARTARSFHGRESRQ